MRLTTALLLLILATTARAGVPLMAFREHNQASRIGAGIATGALNGREAHRLIRGEMRVGSMLRRFASDGHVTPYEAWRADNAQDRMSHRIWREKHDAQRRDVGWDSDLMRTR